MLQSVVEQFDAAWNAEGMTTSFLDVVSVRYRNGNGDSNTVVYVRNTHHGYEAMECGCYATVSYTCEDGRKAYRNHWHAEKWVSLDSISNQSLVAALVREKLPRRDLERNKIELAALGVTSDLEIIFYSRAGCKDDEDGYEIGRVTVDASTGAVTRVGSGGYGWMRCADTTLIRKIVEGTRKNGS